MKIWSSIYENLNLSRFVPINFIQRKFDRVLTQHEFPPSSLFNRRFIQADKVNFVIPLKSKTL